MVYFTYKEFILSDFNEIKRLLSALEVKIGLIEVRLNDIPIEKFTKMQINIALLEDRYKRSSRLNGFLGGFLPSAAIAIYFMVRLNS